MTSSTVTLMSDPSIWFGLMAALALGALVHLSVGLAFHDRVRANGRQWRRLSEMAMPLWLAPQRWSQAWELPPVLADALRSITRFALTQPQRAIKISAVLGWPRYHWRLMQVTVKG